MIRKSKKKGFTLVELVIVIAVIAILAGVMIATFSNVGGKGKCLQSISRDEVACGQRVYRMPDRRKGRPVYCC